MDINETLHEALEYLKNGKYDTSKDILNKILTMQPDNISALHFLGLAFYQEGDLNSALRYITKALSLGPGYADAHYNLGMVLKDSGRSDEAVSCYKKALSLNPKLCNAFFNLACIFHEKNLFDEAVTYYQKTVECDPEIGEAYYYLADIFLAGNQSDKAITCYEKALQFFTQNPEIYNNLGLALEKKGRFSEALICFQKATAIKPEFAEAYNNMGSLLRYNGELEKASASLQKAIDVNPAYADAFVNLGNIFQDEGEIAKAIDHYRKALEIKPDFLTCHSNLLFTLNYDSRSTAGSIFNEHLLFAEHYTKHLRPPVHANDCSQNRRLKIGYVSPDFKRHPVSCFIEPVLSAHDHGKFEIFCYMNFHVQDETTERLKKYTDCWRDISGLTDKEAAGLIIADGIDILADLAGHTANNRIMLFALKPAPVQISWTGYLATTGLSAVDYRITDTYADPPGMTEQYYTEELIRLPHSFLCYLPDKDSAAVSEMPFLKNGYVTFGSFNKLAKLSPEAISVWSKILKETPDSRLVLKAFSFFDVTTRQRTIDKFVRHGIDKERIKLMAWDKSPKHLEAYNLIDIGLDTFPFNGATTTCEALWMGVPVVTLAGEAYHARTGISLLTNLGLPELAAKTPAEYIEIAATLANDIKRLQSLRVNLRTIMSESPLMNTKKFTENVEYLYRRMWENRCSSRQKDRPILL